MEQVKVISEAKANIVKLWGTPKKIPGQRYRLMHYILRSACEDGTLLYNVVTSEMILLDQTFDLDAVLPGVYDPVMDELIEKRFAVPEDYNEKKSVDQLRVIMRKLSRQKFITGYTIYPTTCCNARCFYCFESEFSKSTMTEQTADAVVDYIAAHCGGNQIDITWFGGEPLVGRHIIDYICNRLNERKIAYTSTMVSNAYLFDENVIRSAVDLWKLNNVQITLDGTEEVYNRTKAYKNVTGSPYQHVLDNIDQLLAAGISVAARLNVTDENGENLSQLIDELHDRFAGKKGFQGYAHPIYDNVGYEPVSYTDEGKADLYDTYVQLMEKLVSRGLSYGVQKLPKFREIRCMADNSTSVTVFPDGRIGKCENSSADDAVGNIFGEEYPEKLAMYKKYIENETCRNCSLYPDCVNLAVCPEQDQCGEKRAAYKICKYTELLPVQYRLSRDKERKPAETDVAEQLCNAE